MNISSIIAGSIFSNTPLNPEIVDADSFFTKVTEGIELARKGEAGDIVHEGDAPKLDLCKHCAFMTITLTKARCEKYFASGQQLRGWIGGEKRGRMRFSEDGQHVDGFAANGLFQAYGTFEELVQWVEKYLAKGRRRFEDEHYVIWI